MVRSQLINGEKGLGMIFAVRDKFSIDVLYKGSVRLFPARWLELI